MTSPTNRPLFQDPEYVQGQLFALQALILGLANRLSGSYEFREESLERLESAKTALLDTTASDSRLLAIDHCADWVRKVTE